MQPSLEVTFTPADFSSLKQRDLSHTICVVFDILRATTSMTAALSNGAKMILPACDIPDALSLKARHPDAMLAGERFGIKIRASQTGGIDFDFGNSPREFTREKIAGKTLITTTTNGTRALRACEGAARVFAASFLNLDTVVKAIKASEKCSLLAVCAGTFEEAALEDTLAAGALCHALWSRFDESQIIDSARIARELYTGNKNDLLGALSRSRNGRRLLEKTELRDDVAFCAQRDVCQFLAELKDGAIQVV